MDYDRRELKDKLRVVAEEERAYYEARAEGLFNELMGCADEYEGHILAMEMNHCYNYEYLWGRVSGRYQLRGVDQIISDFPLVNIS